MNESAPKQKFPSEIHETLSLASTEPGVYIMKDADGEIIYIGKAKNLKKRLAAYFKNTKKVGIIDDTACIGVTVDDPVFCFEDRLDHLYL